MSKKTRKAFKHTLYALLEQRAEIRRLKSKIDALETRLARLEKEVVDDGR